MPCKVWSGECWVWSARMWCEMLNVRAESVECRMNGGGQVYVCKYVCTYVVKQSYHVR